MRHDKNEKMKRKKYVSLALSFSDSCLLPLPQILRAEEEKKLTEQKKAEEERKLREESERKQKEQEEKRKRLEEAEKKRQAMMKGSSVSCKTLFVRSFSGWKEEREKGLQEVPVMSAALPDTTHCLNLICWTGDITRARLRSSFPHWTSFCS